MLLCFNLKANSIRFDPSEERDLRLLLNKAGIEASWFAGVKFYWNCDMELEVNGAYTIFEPDSVFLTKSFRGCLDRVTAVAAHELCHRNDYMQFKLLYFIMMIPILRIPLLEKKAEAVQLLVDEKLGIDERLRL